MSLKNVIFHAKLLKINNSISNLMGLMTISGSNNLVMFYKVHFNYNIIFSGNLLFFFDAKITFIYCLFIKNKSNKNFLIKFFKIFFKSEINFTQVKFIENSAKFGLLQILNSKIIFLKTIFSKSKEAKNLIFINFGTLNIIHTNFSQSEKVNHHYNIYGIQTIVHIEKTIFNENLKGGAIIFENSDLIKVNDSSFFKADSIFGSGINLKICENIFLNKLKFDGNIAEFGGAAYLIDIYEIKIINCIFLNNRAKFGADLYVFKDNSFKIFNFLMKLNKFSKILGTSINALNLDLIKIIETEFIGIQNLSINDSIQFLKILNAKEIIMNKIKTIKTFTLSSIDILNCTLTSVSIINSNFSLGKSISNGGLIKIMGKNIIFQIESSFFNKGNSMKSGGAIYFECEIENCSLKLINTKTHFFENIAKKAGQAVEINKNKLSDFRKFNNNCKKFK